MEQPPVQPFDDAALKSALKGALGRESAPESLRQKIAALAGKEPAIRAVPTGSVDEGAGPDVIPLFKKTRWFKFAAAAVLVLGLGGVAFQIWRVTRPPGDTQYVIPNSVKKGMIALHASRIEGTATPPDVVTDFGKAGSLTKELNRDVFVADLAKEGWKFEGGAVRKMEKHDVAQLYFTKGDAAISVFSLPASAASNAPDGLRYSEPFMGTPISGFVKKDNIFCAVGTSKGKSLTLDELKGLVDKHIGDIASK